MAWIASRYWPSLHTGDEPKHIYINLDTVSSVRATSEGKARIIWHRGDLNSTLILAEDYETFVDSVERMT